MLTIRGILHPTDFSDLSNNAFRLACSLADDYHAPLYVLHVSTAFEAYKGELIWDEHPAQYLAKDWERLGKLQHHGLEIHRCLEEGDPAEQILHMASILPCDFIVMGSHGRSGLNRFLLGSVSEHVVRGAACQVLIVKAPFVALEEPDNGDSVDPVAADAISAHGSPHLPR